MEKIISVAQRRQFSYICRAQWLKSIVIGDGLLYDEIIRKKERNYEEKSIQSAFDYHTFDAFFANRKSIGIWSQRDTL